MPDPLQIPKLVVSICGLLLSLTAGVVALRTFLRNEKWRRAEFLAREMKEFFADERVQKSLTLIDWGVRRMKLFADGESVVVTRALQALALRPHILLNTSDSDLMMDAEANDVSQGAFTPSEARIRDCYDGLLDGLERLSSYVQTGLVEISALRPYIGYWIDDIHSSSENKMDCAWAGALLTYINFYRYQGVLWLFSEFGREIGPSSDAYRGFLKNMQDQDTAARLARSIGVIYP